MSGLDMLECRNCHLVWDVTKLSAVYPGHRFCKKCYDKMVEIGQVVRCPQRRDGTMVMLWQGDPFGLRNRDPYQKMFRPGQSAPMIPPSARDT